MSHSLAIQQADAKTPPLGGLLLMKYEGSPEGLRSSCLPERSSFSFDEQVSSLFFWQDIRYFWTDFDARVRIWFWTARQTIWFSFQLEYVNFSDFVV